MTGRRLNEGQLEEIKILAKTMCLKEIAEHFNIGQVAFRAIRSWQLEIDEIYKEASSSNRVFTKEEIVEIEQLLQTMNLERVSRHFNASINSMKKARSAQPELNEAIINGVASRSGGCFVKQKIKKVELQKSQQRLEVYTRDAWDKLDFDSLTRGAPPNISYEDAISRFYKLKNAEKTKRIKEEIRELGESDDLL